MNKSFVVVVTPLIGLNKICGGYADRQLNNWI